MTKRIFFLLVLAFGFTSLFAQEDDAFVTTGLADEMTSNPEQTMMWRKGETVYPSAPKDTWELGVSLGHMTINGDVPQILPSGFGVGLHVRNAINYVFSWRLEGLYSTARGLDGRATHSRVLNLDNSTAKLPSGYRTFRNFKTTNLSGGLSLFVNIGNVLFHKPSNNWNFYIGGGLAITKADVKMNYLDGDSPYDWAAKGISLSSDDANSRDRRKDIWEALDDSWETDAENDRQVPLFNDNDNVFPSFLGTVGVSRKINRRMNISLEHQFFVQDYDKWDGHEWREADTADGGGDQTNDSDMGHYTNVRLAFNLGNLDNRTEPMYWLNPLDAAYNDIAALKRRPELDLTDTDGDGVIDMLDQEPNTDEGCPVDTRGITLDSDMDGISDCKDKEVYSPPGYEIDSDGVAQIPAGLNEGDVVDIINTNVPGMIDEKTRSLAKTGCGEWFLPMIHFDLDKYSIKPEFYSQLHHVANVMKMCPSICVSVVGHTDKRANDDYNRVLSYNRSQAAVDYLVSNYGLDRSRFRLMYGGENTPLINNTRTEAQHYMNRRVEFRVCQPGDNDMSRPAGPSAGTGSRSAGSTYSGNKNSGY